MTDEEKADIKIDLDITERIFKKYGAKLKISRPQYPQFVGIGSTTQELEVLEIDWTRAPEWANYAVYDQKAGWLWVEAFVRVMIIGEPDRVIYTTILMIDPQPPAPSLNAPHVYQRFS